MIELAFISPIKHLEQVSAKGDIEFCLAHIALKSRDYYNYYVNQAKSKFTLLDNGEHERAQVSRDELFEIAQGIGVDEIVIPDTLYDGKDTIKKAKSFLKQYSGYALKYSFCFAVQGKNFEDWKKCFEYGLNEPAISTIGLTFDIPFGDFYAPNKTLVQVQRRLNLLDEISRTYVKARSAKQVHLLGLSDPLELLFAKQYFFVRSNDSSSVVIHGISGIEFTKKGLPNDKINKYLDFNIKINKDKLLIINNNIKIIRGLAQ